MEGVPSNPASSSEVDRSSFWTQDAGRGEGRRISRGPPGAEVLASRGASAKMAAARGVQLATWGARLWRGLAASRQAVLSPGPLAAAVAGVALAGAGAAWHHGRVNVAAPEGSLTVLAQVRRGPFRQPQPSSSFLRRWGPWGAE